MLSRILFFLILFLSGFTSLINQVVWQRAIKVYLGGADAICSMIVVFVFMVGLGIGSLIISKVISKIKNPLYTIAKLEISLFVTNLIVLLLLKSDISETIFSFQRAAMALGISLKFLYAISSIALLIIPCSLMGMTMSVASEAAKRQLNINNPWILDNMFFINTIGSCLGSVATGFKFLPLYGQTICLIASAILNIITALVSFSIFRLLPKNTETATSVESLETTQENSNRKIKPEEIATFLLGFVSLGYEMFLYRALPLIYHPFPYIFSTILALYLLSWAIGVSLSGYLKERICTFIVLCGTIILFLPYAIELQRSANSGINSYIFVIYYCLPSLIFGILFGQLLNRQLDNWGTDVGRFMGLNTIGSCLGIIATTMIGGYVFYHFTSWIFAAIMFSVATWLWARESKIEPVKKYCGLSIAAVCSIIMAALTIEGGINPAIGEGGRLCYSDPAGITEILSDGRMIWDGMWHSQISDGKKSYILENNWLLAVIPYLCSNREKIDNALVVGMGIGITVGVLAKSPSIEKIRTYEINQSIDMILNHFATGTLHINTNPKVEIIYQDARSGLSLDKLKYPLITQQPLYLRQAGSSNLLSEEYLKTVSERMTDDGVLLVYANSLGCEAQKLVIHKTLKKVFPYCVSFLDRYAYVVSKSPITFNRESIEKKLSVENDDLVNEIKSAMTVDDILNMKDTADFTDWQNCQYTVTDDCPILEYPEILTEISKNWK